MICRPESTHARIIERFYGRLLDQKWRSYGAPWYRAPGSEPRAHSRKELPWRDCPHLLGRRGTGVVAPARLVEDHSGIFNAALSGGCWRGMPSGSAVARCHWSRELYGADGLYLFVHMHDQACRRNNGQVEPEGATFSRNGLKSNLAAVLFHY